jgi:phosphoribosylanthranilate isomerase
MGVQVKICGLSTPETLDAALRGGASHIGLNFFPKSPRYVDFARAAALAERAGGRTTIVGLFVNPDAEMIAEARRVVPLDIIQLHGDESPAQIAKIRSGGAQDIWKAMPIRTSADLRDVARYDGAASLILYDAKPPKGADLPGGNGLRFDWTLLQGFRHPLPWALSGGLDPANVAEAIATTGAQIVDVSSGVESAAGIKDVDKIAAFLKAASTS